MFAMLKTFTWIYLLLTLILKDIRISNFNVSKFENKENYINNPWTRFCYKVTSSGKFRKCFNSKNSVH